MREDIKDAVPLDGEVITVVAGEQQTLFYVHRAILTKSSDLFKNALKGPFKEAEEKRIQLPDHKPSIFRIYMLWLYLNKLYSHGKRDEDEAHMELEVGEWDTLFLLSIFGDAVQDSEFCNTVVDACIDSMNEVDGYPGSMAAAIYSNLPETSGFRRLYVDVWAYGIRPHWFTGTDRDLSTDAPKEFWIDVARRIADMKAEKSWEHSAPWIVNPCQYHIHADGEKCEAKHQDTGDSPQTPTRNKRRKIRYGTS